MACIVQDDKHIRLGVSVDCTQKQSWHTFEAGVSSSPESSPESPDWAE